MNSPTGESAQALGSINELHEVTEPQLSIIDIPVTGEYVSVHSLIQWIHSEHETLNDEHRAARQQAPNFFTPRAKTIEHEVKMSEIAGRRTELNRLTEVLNTKNT